MIGYGTQVRRCRTRRAVGALLAAVATAVALVAGAASAQTPSSREIHVYTDRDPAFIDFLVTAFAIESGLQVRMHYGEPAELRNEMLTEPHDAVIATDTRWLVQLARDGLTTPFESSIVAARVPQRLRDPQNRWFGVSQRARVFHVSSERVENGAIRTYEDLGSFRWRGKVCMRSFEHGYSLQLIGAMIGHYGFDGAQDWLSGLRANLATPPEGNDRAQIRKVAEGVCDIAVANSYYRGIMAENPKQRDFVAATRMVVPVFSGGATHVTLTSAALLDGAPNPEGAKRFLEFLLSETAQKIMMTHNFEHPIAAEAALTGLVATWGPFEADNLPIAQFADLARLAQAIAATPGN